MRRTLFTTALLFTVCVLPLGLVTSVPRGPRSYVPEQAVQPPIHIQGTHAWIDSVRAFDYGERGEVRARWVQRAYDLAAIRGVWFGLSPFAEWQGPAHAFVSFEFADSQFVSISVEARKETGESYSPLRGAFRQYELIFVIAEERDVVGLRTHVHRDPVYLYPGRATPEQARRLFVALLRRAQALRTAPEFYHTATNNCATNLADAVNEIAPRRLRWSHALLLPGYSDEFAWEQGLLAIEASPAEVRERYRVNERAERAWGQPGFSRAIRSALE